MLAYLVELKGRLLSQKKEALTDMMKSAPSVAAAGWTWLTSLPLDTWVQVSALVYTLLQMYFLLRDRRKTRRPRK
jgi:hypothetical protein